MCFTVTCWPPPVGLRWLRCAILLRQASSVEPSYTGCHVRKGDQSSEPAYLLPPNADIAMFAGRAASRGEQARPTGIDRWLLPRAIAASMAVSVKQCKGCFRQLRTCCRIGSRQQCAISGLYSSLSGDWRWQPLAPMQARAGGCRVPINRLRPNYHFRRFVKRPKRPWCSVQPAALMSP